jgi:hypothetical protein
MIRWLAPLALLAAVPLPRSCRRRTRPRSISPSRGKLIYAYDQAARDNKLVSSRVLGEGEDRSLGPVPTEVHVFSSYTGRTPEVHSDTRLR